MTVILDYGHGGVNSDGVYTTAPQKMFRFPDGHTNYEGEINRKIGGMVYWLLRWAAYDKCRVVETVSHLDSMDMSLNARVKMANSIGGDKVFISIHSNASPTHKARGFEVFTTRGNTESDSLADLILRSVAPFLTDLGVPMRTDLTDGDLDREADFYVLKRTNCPAVLIENLFFDNRSDSELLNNVDFQFELAKHIFRGVEKYLIINNKKK